MISIDIKNRLSIYYAKLVKILDFNSKRLSIKKEGIGETYIYYICYDKYPFYLVIDDLKAYFEQNEDNKCLTLILKCQRQKMIYTKIWEEIKKLVNEVDNFKFSNYDKDYGIISFDTNDILPLNSTINIYSMTIVIKYVFKDDNKFYPQIYLTNCTYDKI